jgi:predicted dehydrogenase
MVGLNFGRHIIKLLHQEPARRYFKLGAVCDMNEARAVEYGQVHGIPHYLSLDELLANPEIPVIGLFTGPAGRAELLRKIIRAGKDAITTKPFELDPVAARDVLEEARELGRLIYLNSPGPRPVPILAKIQEWEKTYGLGQPVYGHAEMACHYREQADGSWYDDPERCPVAPIYRLGIYVINALLWVFGEAREVQVTSSRVFTGRPTADNAQLTLRFRSGALGSVYSSFCVNNGQEYANSLVLHYENGTIHHNIAPMDPGRIRACSRLELIAERDGQPVRDSFFTETGLTAYQWEEFHRGLTTRDADRMPAAHITAGVDVLAAMVRAERSGRAEAVGG